jgi:hypothetical protein
LKKLAAILFLVLYLSGVTGLTFTMHYCAGDLKYFSLAGEQEDNCCDETERSWVAESLIARGCGYAEVNV